jgi:hypothetical protein
MTPWDAEPQGYRLTVGLFLLAFISKSAEEFAIIEARASACQVKMLAALQNQ